MPHFACDLQYRPRAGKRKWDAHAALGEIEHPYRDDPPVELRIAGRRRNVAGQPAHILPQPQQLAGEAAGDQIEAAAMALEVVVNH